MDMQTDIEFTRSTFGGAGGTPLPLNATGRAKLSRLRRERRVAECQCLLWGNDQRPDAKFHFTAWEREWKRRDHAVRRLEAKGGKVAA